jgi:hypothetical protein
MKTLVFTSWILGFFHEFKDVLCSDHVNVCCLSVRPSVLLGLIIIDNTLCRKFM